MKSNQRPSAARRSALIRLPGTRSRPLPGAAIHAPGSPRTPLWITLRLRPKSRNLLAAVQEVAEGRRAPYTYPEFAAAFSMSEEDRAAVETWARRERVRILGLNQIRRTVVIRASAGKLARLFGVTRVRYRLGNREFSGRTGSISVPAELASIVTGVSGFDGAPIASRSANTPADAVAQGAAAEKGFSPLEIAGHYAFPEESTGRGQTVGVIALGGGYLQRDMATYFRTFKVRPPRISNVSVLGATNNPSIQDLGPDGEDTGDLQTLCALVPGAHIVVYFAPNTERGFMAAVEHAIHDRRHQPSVLSVSWGRNESHWTRRTLRQFNLILAEAALLGITVCCSSGDFGAFADPRDRKPSVCFPGCSPYVLSCGGTSLTRQPGGGLEETPWANSRGASGGGVSRLFTRPDWQKSGAIPRSRELKAGRGLPDVAANADPLTGYRVFFRGKWYVGAGTSAAAPLWAALVVRLNALKAGRVGLMTPTLFRRHQNLLQAGALRAIADPGGRPGNWSPHTGLGAPHGSKLARALGIRTALGPRRRRARQD